MWWNLNCDGPYFTEERIKTVKDMYDYASENSIALLGEYLYSPIIASFWDEYVNNFELRVVPHCRRLQKLRRYYLVKHPGMKRRKQKG